MKPWHELTDIEKREQIALRLGTWRKATSGLWIPSSLKPGVPWCATALPDWPTNDGLAFAEVWTRLAINLPHVGISNNYQVGVWDLGTGEQQVFHGETFADAICRAAYELLPIPSLTKTETLVSH